MNRNNNKSITISQQQQSSHLNSQNNNQIMLQYFSTLTLKLSKTFKQLNQLTENTLKAILNKRGINTNINGIRKNKHLLNNKIQQQQQEQQQIDLNDNLVNGQDEQEENLISMNKAKGKSNKKRKNIMEAEEENQMENKMYQNGIIINENNINRNGANKSNTKEKSKANHNNQRHTSIKQNIQNNNIQKSLSNTNIKKPVKPLTHKPKAPTSSFLLFFKQQQQSISRSYPNYSVVQLTRLTAKCWNQLSAEQKQPYQKAFQIERIKYREEMENYRREFPEEVKKNQMQKKERKKAKAQEKKEKQKHEKNQGGDNFEKERKIIVGVNNRVIQKPINQNSTGNLKNTLIPSGKPEKSQSTNARGATQSNRSVRQQQSTQKTSNNKRAISNRVSTKNTNDNVNNNTNNLNTNKNLTENINNNSTRANKQQQFINYITPSQSIIIDKLITTPYSQTPNAPTNAHIKTTNTNQLPSNNNNNSNNNQILPIENNNKNVKIQPKSSHIAKVQYIDILGSLQGDNQNISQEANSLGEDI